MITLGPPPKFHGTRDILQIIQESPSTNASATPANDSESPPVNERGHIVKALGDTGGFGDAKGEVRFTLDKVEVDPACSEYGMPPESGHTLVLHFRVATGPDATWAQATSSLLNPYSFAEITSDGLTKAAIPVSCAASAQERLPRTYGVNQQYAGLIEIVVPEASGTLALTPPQGCSNPTVQGWEWHY